MLYLDVAIGSAMGGAVLVEYMLTGCVQSSPVCSSAWGSPSSSGVGLLLMR
ncbi:MAG: hypothetical protein ACTHM1_04440 [Solirubrobacteraceae bacterium]